MTWMAADREPIAMGSVEIALERFLGIGGLNAVEGEVVFHPRVNAVSLDFRHEMVNYRLFWDAAGRQRFISALARYNEDFDSRALVDRHRRTQDVYGRVPARIEWQTARFTTPNAAYPTLELGYRIREGAAFLTVLARAAPIPDASSSGSGQTESRRMTLFLTRAAAADIAAIFDPSFLAATLAPPAPPAPPAPLGGEDTEVESLDSDGASD